MKFTQISCTHCGANVELDLDNLAAYCPFCGAKLQIDIEDLSKVLIEREHTKQHEMDIAFEERKHQRELEREKEQDKEFDDFNKKVMIGSLIFCVVVWIAGYFLLKP